MEEIVPTKEHQPSTSDQPTNLEKVLALALEFASRVSAAETLDELYFMLTNDLRALAEFDRCFLITHFDKHSQFVVATHQPVLDGKSRLQDKIHELADNLRQLDTPVVCSKKIDIAPGELSAERQAAIDSYIELSGCDYFCCIPLVQSKAICGHLILEYFGENIPDKNAVMAVAKVAPVFAAALSDKWLLENHPKIARLKSNWETAVKPRAFSVSYISLFLIGVAVAALVFLLMPVSFSVGGEALIASKEKQYAFCKIGGLIDKVYVRHGDQIEKGQELATLDAREMEHKIKSEERQFEILTREMELIRSRAIDDPSMLSKSKLVELKRESVKAELDFLRWQSRFLVILAPVSGVIVTKDVETLSGKKLEAGEPFCEIAEPGLLCANIFVPEDRIMRVKTGQNAYVYLNNEPRRSYKAKVDEIAPRPEVEPRLGNVYKVTTIFNDSLAGIKVGMKGVGNIDTGTTNIWSLVSLRLAARLNQLLLYFW